MTAELSNWITITLHVQYFLYLLTASIIKMKSLTRYSRCLVQIIFSSNAVMEPNKQFDFFNKIIIDHQC